MKRKSYCLRIICCIGMLVLCSQPAYAVDNIDGGAGVLLLLLLVGAPIAAFFWWLMRTPPTIKAAQTREKNAIAEASAKTLGIVILSFQLGHQVTSFHYDGSKYQYIASGPNNVGGWTCKIRIINSCSRTIKYCCFNTHAVNAVGDPALCQISHTSDHSLRGTGPVISGQQGEWQWDDFCYSNDLSRLNISTVDVTYMDGSTESIPGYKIVWRNT